MVKRTLDEIRNDLEIKEDENASLRNELAVCRANIARFEGIMGYLEGENKVLKDKVSSLQSELKTEQESARLRLGVASEIAPIPAIEIPDQHQEKLQILRSKVEREKERASRINLSKVSENPTES